jgi:hypothetical protein
MYNTTVPISTKRVAILGLLVLLPALARTQTADSPAITDLLKEVKAHAVLAEEDSDTLESYTRSSTISWENHAFRLSTIKNHADDLNKDFNQLSSMRDQGSPWQQEAIDRINPLLHEMSDHLSATIKHLNENQSRVHMPAFRDYAHANRELMTRTSQLISDLVDYGEAKTKANALEKTLDLPTEAKENE